MAEKPKLAVVLGAGASYDVCPWDDKIGNKDWRPPLVEHMFESPAFHEVLRRYPAAEALMSSIRADMAHMSFERSIRRQRDSADPRVKQQMRFVPVALREFFYGVGQSFVTDAANYSVLIDRTVCRGIRTAFITTNYDTLLERSLTRFENTDFNTEDAYTSSPDWMLAKLHGCATWGIPWEVASPAPTMFSKLPSSDPLPRSDPALIRVGIHNPDLRQEDTLFYPAMVLPADDKKGFMCPPKHLETLVDFLADCPTFLFIGFSSRDEDLLELLSQVLPRPTNAWVVAPDAPQVAARLIENVRQFRTSGPSSPGIRVYPAEFSAYVTSSAGLDSLVTSLVG
jgi:hypothetical protein